MKASFIFYSLILLNITSIKAQDSLSTDTIKVKAKNNIELPSYLPKEGDLGITLNISQIFSDFKVNAPSNGVYEHIFLRKYLKNQTALRFGFGLNTNSGKVNLLDSLNGFEIDTDSTYSQNEFYLSFGVEKHVFTNSRLDPYFAPSISYGRIGIAKSNNIITTRDTIGESSITTTIEQPGGSNFRIGIAVGFNYFFAKKLAVGAEYSIGYNYTTLGGDYSNVIINRDLSGVETVKRTSGTNFTSKGGISMLGSGKLSVSYFF